MDPVSSINQAIQTLRQRLSERPLSAHKAKPGSTKGTLRIRREAILSKTEVQKNIAEAIKVSPDQSDKKKAEILVEHILAWQLGDELFNDAVFDEMVKEVVATLKSDDDQWLQLKKYLNKTA